MLKDITNIQRNSELSPESKQPLKRKPGRPRKRTKDDDAETTEIEVKGTNKRRKTGENTEIITKDLTSSENCTPNQSKITSFAKKTDENDHKTKVSQILYGDLANKNKEPITQNQDQTKIVDQSKR